MLEKQPKNLEALVLASGAASTPDGVEAAIGRLEAARAEFGSQAKLHLALGTLYLRKRDVAAAEQAFQEAWRASRSRWRHHWRQRHFLVGKSDATAAEREFKTAADLGPVGSAARVRLADFYLTLRRQDEANQTLTEITRRRRLPARMAAPGFAFTERKWTSGKALDVVAQEEPTDLDGTSCAPCAPGKGRDDRRHPGFQTVLRPSRGWSRRYRSHWPI